MSNPTYSSDPADQNVDPLEVPAYDPSQGGTESLGYTETPAYTTGTPTYTESTAGNPYTTATGDPYAVGEPDYSATGGGDQSTKGVAKEEASNLKDTAVDAGKGVAATAKDQAVNVATEAK